MKATVFSAKLGRLVLTDRRLVFLSFGQDLMPRRLANSTRGREPRLATAGSSTAPSTPKRLNNEGSLSIPLASIPDCTAGRSVRLSWRTSEDGTERSYTFGEKMGMPARDSWVERIDRLRISPPKELHRPRGWLDYGSSVIGPKILIDAGRHIHTGTALADNTIAGWCATVAGADGSLRLRGTVRGKPDPIYADLAPDALLRNNPRMLYGQVVRHRLRPSSLDAAGWVISMTWTRKHRRWCGSAIMFAAPCRWTTSYDSTSTSCGPESRSSPAADDPSARRETRRIVELLDRQRWLRARST